MAQDPTTIRAVVELTIPPGTTPDAADILRSTVADLCNEVGALVPDGGGFSVTVDAHVHLDNINPA